MSRIKIDTNHYAMDHGHQPRGVGMWAFFFSYDDYHSPNYTEKALWVTGSYLFARTQAERVARRRGASVIIVGS